MSNKNNIMQKLVVVVILATICDLLWGSAFPCIKLGYEYFSIPAEETATQILFAGLRFTLAGLLVILFISLFAYASRYFFTFSSRNEHRLDTFINYILMVES